LKCRRVLVRISANHNADVFWQVSHIPLFLTQAVLFGTGGKQTRLSALWLLIFCFSVALQLGWCLRVRELEIVGQVAQIRTVS